MHATDARALARRRVRAGLTGVDGSPTQSLEAQRNTPVRFTLLRSLDGVRATPARQTGT